MNEAVHIALAVHDESGTYIRHTAVAMVSVFTNTRSKVHIHLLHDKTLRIESKERLKRICNTYDQEISFHFVTIEINEKAYPALKDFSIGTLFRLKILEVLPQLDRIIYLDNDIVCNLNVKNLWEVDISGYAVGVVADPCTYDLENIPAERMAFYHKVPIMNKCYFNAGMIYFNLEHMKKEKYDLFQESICFLNKYPDAFLPDQDALNFLFQKSCIHLDEKYNRLVPYFLRSKKDFSSNQEAIWHFIGVKPWKRRIYPIDKIYWENLRLTPWDKDFYLGDIYDCFVYDGQLELLELRLSLLEESVKYFVIIEFLESGTKGKDIYSFEKIKNRFLKYNNKIIHLKIEGPLACRENYLKNGNSFEWIHGLFIYLRPNDIIALSEISEIPHPDILQSLASTGELLSRTPLVFEQDNYYQYINWKTDEIWTGTVIAQCKNIKSIAALYDDRNQFPQINNGGWHFTYLGEDVPLRENGFLVKIEETGLDIFRLFAETYPHLVK